MMKMKENDEEYIGNKIKNEVIKVKEYLKE
jgi:hypothetical protein